MAKLKPKGIITDYPEQYQQWAASTTYCKAPRKQKAKCAKLPKKLPADARVVLLKRTCDQCRQKVIVSVSGKGKSRRTKGKVSVVTKSSGRSRSLTRPEDIQVRRVQEGEEIPPALIGCCSDGARTEVCCAGVWSGGSRWSWVRGLDLGTWVGEGTAAELQRLCASQRVCKSNGCFAGCVDTGQLLHMRRGARSPEHSRCIYGFRTGPAQRQDRLRAAVRRSDAGHCG